MPAPVDVALVRRRNMSLVLHALDAQAPCSRSELRRATGLVSASVTTMVEELTARGLVEEVGIAQGARGRPRRLLRLRPGRVLTIVVQLTHREVFAEVVDLAGDSLWLERQPHDIRYGDGERMVELLADALDRCWDAALAMPGAWVGEAVVAVPAPVIEGSAVGRSIDLGLGRTEVREAMRSRLRHPCDPVILNDGRLGALAEYTAFEPEHRPRAMACIIGDEGVGGGIVVDGRLYLGSHAMAGECGHISVDMEGIPCDCGARGCLTLYLGTTALFEATGLTGCAAARGHGAAMDELVGRLETGDESATSALERAGAALSSAIATMSNLLDVDVVVLSGQLPRLAPWLQPRVEAMLQERARKIREFNPRVLLGHHGHDGVRRGAWMLARDRILEDPDRVPRQGAVAESSP